MAGCHTVEAAHPGFQATAIGIDVLHVIDPGDDADAGGQIHGTVGKPHFAGHANHCPAAIRAQNGACGQYWLKGIVDVRPVILLQYEIGRAASLQHERFILQPAKFVLHSSERKQQCDQHRQREAVAVVLGAELK